MSKIAAIYLATACALYAMGRSVWCACGELRFWVGEAQSNHTSQHFFDPYSFSHLQHGLFFFALLVILKKERLYIALILEAIWEIIENTPYVINRYRHETSSLDYSGDSIVNSLGDLTSCAIGYWLARRLPWKISLALFVVIEALMVYTIKDSLLINVIMLIYPIAAIKEWQTGAVQI